MKQVKPSDFIGYFEKASRQTVSMGGHDNVIAQKIKKGIVL